MKRYILFVFVLAANLLNGQPEGGPVSEPGAPLPFIGLIMSIGLLYGVKKLKDK